MVAALYSNPNWDDEANDRTARVKELNKHFNHAIELIYDPDLDKGQEIDWSSPFWQAHLRAINQTRERFGLANRDITMQNVIDSDAQEKERLQALERRAELRRQVDQLATS
jgi:hypothetical protein